MRYIFEERLLVCIILIQVFFVCLGVLSRYAFGWSLSFTEELTRYLIVWLACLGFPACVARKEMIRFQWPWKKSSKFYLLTRYVSGAASVVFFIVLLVSSLKMILLQWRFEQKTSVMGWPILWVSIALPLCCVLYIYRMSSKTNRNT